MPTSLLKTVSLFQNNSDNFINILCHFESKINYLSYKLNYPEASSDLVIYLFELLLKLDCNKFNSDEQILKYIRKCIENKAIHLSYKLIYDKKFIFFNSDEEIVNLIDENTSNNYLSNIVFKDLISFLKPKQQKIIIYKFYYGLSDNEIAKIFQISRQAVNKSLRNCLKKIKLELSMEALYV